jgi:hypothetical protein
MSQQAARSCPFTDVCAGVSTRPLNACVALPVGILASTALPSVCYNAGRHSTQLGTQPTDDVAMLGTFLLVAGSLAAVIDDPLHRPTSPQTKPPAANTACLAALDEGVKPVTQTSASDGDQNAQAAHKLPVLPKAITSFGAATIGDQIYVYGGHHGKAHHYNDAGQSGDLLQLDGTAGKAWQTLATGPRLQGLALVAHGGAVYRVGGFEARNNESEEQNLWSLAEFARYDLKQQKWHPLPPMPAPRSSFDAAVNGDRVVVVGGWSMQGGDKNATWLETAVMYDLRQTDGQWSELPKPPFQRRALSVGALGQNIYAIGGMQPDGKVTRRTAIFDLKANAWREGPELPGEDMEGFGSACCELGDRLYVSTMSGKLWRLSRDEKSWEPMQPLADGRFFHRMLPLSHDRLVLFGGASMQRGKHASVEVVSPQPAKP